MTATLISLISIVFGIFGSYALAFFFKKYSMEIVGNTIAGVFGSILVIKSFGRLGFDPSFIVSNEQVAIPLFVINLIVSFLGGVLALLFISKINSKINT